MSDYIIKKLADDNDVPVWAIPIIEKAVEEQEKESGIILDRLIYHDYGKYKFLNFKTEKKLKDYIFKISGQSNVYKEKKTAGKFYAVNVSLIVDSEEIQNFYEPYYLPNVNSFMEYAETPEFDEYVDEIRKNNQLIKDLKVKNEEIKDIIQQKISNLEQD